VYDCTDRGLKERIDDANASEMKSFFDMEVLTAKLVKRKMMIDQEAKAAATLMNPAEFNATAAKVAYTEANIDTIDFAYDIQECQARLESKAVEANTMIITRALWNLIRRTKLLQTYLFNNLNTTGRRLIRPSDIEEGFMIDKVIIAKANYDSAQKGKTKVLGPIWGNEYIWLGKVVGGDFQNGGSARCIVWGADSPGGLYTTETWRDEDRRGDMVRVRSHTAEKVIDQTTAELITTGWE